MNETHLWHDMLKAERAVHKDKQVDKNDQEFKPKKDKSIKVPRLYEFQFYDNFEEVQELGREIQKL